MSLPILVIDNDSEITKREQNAWMKQGIETIQVYSMQDAIKILSQNEMYLVICINADNINYRPLLHILRKITCLPIFIITSNFSISEQVETLQNGADFYSPFHTNSDENVKSALAVLYRYHEHNKQSKKHKILIYENLILLPDFRQVFCNDTEIILTKKEFDILYYLLSNLGYSLSYSQIYRKVWGAGFDDLTHNAVWNHVMNLRRKIGRVANNDGYIENIRDYGYKMPILNIKNK